MIKKLITLTAGALFSLAAAAENGAIEVVVKSLHSDKGTVVVSLHNSKDTFLSSNDSSLAKSSAAIKDGVATVTFENQPYGTYAVAVYHDEDGDGKMKTVYGSIPIEGMGVSKDAKGQMGPPKYDDAKFDHAAAKTETVINVIY